MGRRQRVRTAFGAAAVAAALWLAGTQGVEQLTERAFAAGSGSPSSAVAPGPGQKVTLLELGSTGCKACKAMVPVMEAVRQRYGDRVQVTFHDVKKEASIAEAYRVMLIPTQVFLDARGREVFRHEGYLPFDRIEEILRQMGVESASSASPR